MQLKSFVFEKPEDRPFLYTTFASTIDGKIIVKDEGYWPIGSKADYEYFTYLRAHADAIVDAKNTALQFGKYTIKTIHDHTFQTYRRELGKKELPEYIVLTSNSDDALEKALANDLGFVPTILTPKAGQSRVLVDDLIDYLNGKGYKNVFIDGGPILIAQLIQEKVLDEVHLTIAPKIFGSRSEKTLTMCEGILFPSSDIPKFKLKSVHQEGDEVMLRYQAQKD